MNSNTYNIVIISLLMLVIDSVYLMLVGKPIFSKKVAEIQRSPLTVNMLPAGVVYMFLIFALNYFIISQNKTPIDAFILGICTYGVFDFTNMAIFKNYGLKTALIDTLWGGILFFLVTYIIYELKKKM